MKYRPNTWALVLAAGDGSRLASLTTDHQGLAVPKQFCSLNGGQSLLQASLQRALRIVPYRRICTVVARSHEGYWRPMLWSMPEGNVIVQPRNRGTANGLLLGALRILKRDPLARIIFLPADHHVLDEKSLTDSVRAAATLFNRDRKGLLRERLLLVGISPDEADLEFGYIVPGAPIGDGIHRVLRFVEKPTAAVARDLVAQGAVWSSFILAAHGTAVIARIRNRYPDIVDGMTGALTRDMSRGNGTSELDRFYEHLPTLDFSRSVVQGEESALCVFTAPACGWTDLGTPRRVKNALQRLWSAPQRGAVLATRHVPAFVNLAARYAQFSGESADTGRG